MEDFLSVLKVKPVAKDGTLELPVEAAGGGGNGSAGNSDGTGHTGDVERRRGLSIEFSNVHFGYTEERPVRP
jgi:hypothetical protein